MNSLLLLVAISSVGIEYGWEPLPEGGYEYTVEIEPQLLDILKRGDQQITSTVPPHLDVRRYRLIVGTAKLPRTEVEQPAARSAAAQPSASPTVASQPPGQPTPAQPRLGAPITDERDEPDQHQTAQGQPAGGVPHEATAPADLSDTVGDHRAPHAADPAATHPFGNSPGGPTEDQPERASRLGKAGARGAHQGKFDALPSPPGSPAADNLGSTHPGASHADPADADPTHTDAAHGDLHAGHTPAATDLADKGPAEPPALPKLTNEAQKLEAQQAGYHQPETKKGHGSKTDADEAGTTSEPEAARPWWAFVFVTLLLCCSIGGNIFLGVIARDARARYREAVARFRTAPAV